MRNSSIAGQAVLADGARKLWVSDRQCATVGTGQLALDKISLDVLVGKFAGPPSTPVSA